MTFNAIHKAVIHFAGQLDKTSDPDEQDKLRIALYALNALRTKAFLEELRCEKQPPVKRIMPVG